jgi:hypothetical protein
MPVGSEFRIKEDREKKFDILLCFPSGVLYSDDAKLVAVGIKTRMTTAQ